MGLIVDAVRTLEWGRIKKELLEIDIFDKKIWKAQFEMQTRY